MARFLQIKSYIHFVENDGRQNFQEKIYSHRHLLKQYHLLSSNRWHLILLLLPCSLKLHVPAILLDRHTWVALNVFS